MANPKMERNLQARHISMIAIGGCIGTGLFMASGAVVSKAGSYGAVFTYALIGIIIYFLMASIGELATFYPVSGSFGSYATRFIDPGLGFGIGWLYWILWILVASVDIITLSKILHYWEYFRKFSTFSICIVFLLLLYVLNLVSVKVFGEVEYWITIIKVITVVVFLIVGIAIIFGITNNPDAGITMFVKNGEKTSSAGMLGLFGVFSTAAFSFGGTEVVAVTAGESPNPKETMPKAVKQVFWRILIFYIATMFIISSIVSAEDTRLLDTSNVTASPFTIVFQNIGLSIAAVIMNIVILTSVLSAANSGMYVSSRQLFSLSLSNYGPKAFKKLNSNSTPTIALTFSAIFMILCFAFEKYNSSGYYMLLSMVGIIVMLIWIVSLISQIRLRKAIIIQGKKAEDVLPYTAKTGIVGSYIALIVFILIIILQLISDYLTGGFVQMSYNLVCPAIGLILYLSFKLVTKKKFVKLEEMDINPFNEEK
ncbi:amino acid permease [Gemella cuniculi]|uniref:amino acid permease n=1 Tax=Gemella cuniculi TaxID=150240 RepID=UPI00040B457E|nr:amino acid permease [Gemella cuniculi]